MTTRVRGGRYIVRGEVALRGTIEVSGAKNHALAAMCAALLTDEDVILENVPYISDVDSLGQLLASLGAVVERLPGGALRLNAAGASTCEAPTELISENRASFQVMGPLLGRHGFAASAPPGGDVIGQRPIDVHLSGFEAMGAAVSREGERFVARGPAGGLRGARVFMDYPSVSGTQNVMMAAVLAEGHTTIVNAATEPEVQELAHLLNAMGARISGIGSQMLEIEGVERLHGTRGRIMPDRIEAGTWAIAAVMTGGELYLRDAPAGVMDALVHKLRATGAEVRAVEGGLHVAAGATIRAVSFQALPYPGLATDLHAPFAALLTQANGVSIIHERVFDNRMLYVGELRKMGAEIVSTGSSAIVSGPTPLHGTRVRALDVRAGAAVLLAALVAQGTTIIDDIYHLDRGYERLDEKLRAVGVQVERA
ncbi:UDP-N-acetylglucosamine 1-carboxyvinyltransferase [Tepidiforma sp.]|uniref:UDP-N-acetylglucosamine 1-carboxyvinyltransferase n=1 Tax=Tepidiforma sp. TaxID=2682230 RepID=UPI002ADE7810|nr:UDP-N-acetylglucosamine 1-carboxyvinyltransferase [Tepidiforma sp.]